MNKQIEKRIYKISDNVNFKTLYKRGIWQLNLNYSEKQIQNIIDEVYKLEKEKYTQGSRTFIHRTGFVTGNLLKKKEFTPFINDVLRLVNNELALDLKLKSEFENYAKHPNFFFTTNDVWAIIWRKGDYNLPHHHPNYHIAGAFYFKLPKDPNSGGGLALSNPTKMLYQYLELLL